MRQTDTTLALDRGARATSVADSIRRIAQRMQEIQHYASGIAASIEQQNTATGDISSNVVSAARATQTMAEMLAHVASAAAQTHGSAEIVLDVSRSVDAAVADLRRHVEDFLTAVAAYSCIGLAATDVYGPFSIQPKACIEVRSLSP